MGQHASTPSMPNGRNLQPAMRNNWRFTIRTIELKNRTLTINKEQYKFVIELGSGAFGSVYAAKHLTDDKPVAVKVVSLASLSPDESEFLATSILTEIQMSKRLARATRHVVRMFDFDFHRHSGLAFLVMELGEKDLEKALVEKGRLTHTERKSVWRQLVEIAMVLHNNNIVHLDIKPQNLVVFPGNRIKIVDLGIAQKAYQHRVGSNGTWYYSAPEVTMASRYNTTMTTSKADAWSWGAVLYRMTYMVPPDYKAPCYEPPRSQRSSRDTQLIDVLRHTLVLDPKDRVDPPWLYRHPFTKTN